MNLKEMTPDQLYEKLADLSIKKARLPQNRDQYTAHTRSYYKAEQAQVRAELRRRGLPIRKPTSKRIYPTAAEKAIERAAA